MMELPLSKEEADLVARFALYVQQLGYTPSMCGQLIRPVKECMVFLRETTTDYRSLLDATAGQLVAFYEWLHQRPNKMGGLLSGGYIYQLMYGLVVFYHWWEQVEPFYVSPMSGLEFARPVKVVRQPLTVTEIEALFSGCETWEEKAILHLYYSCGLRCSEGLALNCTDIHFRTNRLYVRSGKGGYRRCVPMPEKVTKDLEQYYTEWRRGDGFLRQVEQGADGRIVGGVLQRRKLLRSGVDSEAFLVGKTGKRMDAFCCRLIWKGLLEKAGLAPRLVLHQLRHSIATHLLAGGVSVEDVRLFLGHKQLKTTQIYTKVSLDQLKKL